MFTRSKGNIDNSSPPLLTIILAFITFILGNVGGRGVKYQEKVVIGIARMVRGVQGLTRENQIEHEMATGIVKNMKDWIAWLI